MLTLALLTSISTLVFDAQSIETSATIYIRADGSVDPSTAPIRRGGNAYTFTGYIFESIVVERDNIVIDGAGYTVLGAGTGIGIDLSERSNVTIKNMEIMAFETGIYLYGVYGWKESSYNKIFGNIVRNNTYGISLVSYANNNSIIDNTLINDEVSLSGGSANNSIIGNTLTGSGIALYYSHDNRVLANNASYISLSSSSNNNIVGNYIKNGTGIQLSGTGNIVVDNTIVNNTDGIVIYDQNNIIYHNNFVNNSRQVYCYSNYVNVWDDGYPSGGNYWSHYTGVDEKNGPKQDQLGSDGIGDTPYVINDYNRDRYPLMNPWIPPPETIPPTTTTSLSGQIGRDDWFTSDVTVTLSATDNIAVEKTEYSFDNITWTTYVAPFTITCEGHTIVYYRSIDKTGNMEAIKTKTIKIDKTPPLGSILINNGNAYTTLRNVTLTLNATDASSGVYQMCFSNEIGGDVSWTYWEPFVTLKNWTITFDWEQALQTRNVSVRVYVQYMDNAGLISMFSDTIILTVKIPTPVVLNSPSNVTSSSVLLTWSKNNDPEFLCYQILWYLQPLEPSAGVGEPQSFERTAMATIYEQSVVSFHVKDLRSSTTYYFMLRTFNHQGIYFDSNIVAVTTKASVPTIAVTWSFDTIIMVSLLIGAIGAVILTLFMSKRSCVESTIISATVGVLLSIVLRPNSNYPPLNFLVFGAVLGGVYGWIKHAIGYTIRKITEGSRLGPRWHTVIVGAVLGCLFGLNQVLFWVFACCGVFVCINGLLFSERAPKNAGRLYFVLGAILGSVIAILAFYLLRGYVLIPGENPVVFPLEIGTVIVLGIVVGSICGLIPALNYIYAFIFGLIIGFNSQHFAYSLTTPFFIIPLFLLPAYIITNKVDKRYDHTKGSRVILVLLFALVTTVSLLVARMQQWNWGLGLVIAVPVWFLTSVALVRIIAELQKTEMERRKLRNGLGKVESSLSKVEAEILTLNKENQDLRQKHDEPLRRRNKLGEEINRLIASDPANLLLKTEEFRKQVQGIPREGIWENMQRIDRDIDRIKQVRKECEKRLNLFAKEREELYSRLRETETRLQRLEMADPKNVWIKLETLQKKWQNLSDSELNAVKAVGDIERLFKEQCLLNFRIEAKNKEIESQHQKIRDTQRSEALLQLEKLVLEQEEITKSLGQDEPRFIEIGNELEKLKAEQLNLTKEKSQISQIFAEMQVAKPSLRVNKSIYLLLVVALIISILLNIFIC